MYKYFFKNQALFTEVAQRNNDILVSMYCELACAPPQKYAEMLIPDTCECDLT